MEYVAESKMDIQSLQVAREVFKSLADGDEDLIIDMEAVDFIDAAGVGALLYIFKRARARRRSLRLINLKGQPKQLLETLHLIALFTGERSS